MNLLEDVSHDQPFIRTELWIKPLRTGDHGSGSFWARLGRI